MPNTQYKKKKDEKGVSEGDMNGKLGGREEEKAMESEERGEGWTEG